MDINFDSERLAVMQEQNFHYLSYLLRIWQDNLNGEWHATLQDVFSDESYSFATLQGLYANLEELTSEKAYQYQINPFDQNFSTSVSDEIK